MMVWNSVKRKPDTTTGLDVVRPARAGADESPGVVPRRRLPHDTFSDQVRAEMSIITSPCQSSQVSTPLIYRRHHFTTR